MALSGEIWEPLGGLLKARVNRLAYQILTVCILLIYFQYTHGGFNYGFVEFNEHQAAEQALQAMAGRSVFGQVR